MDDSLDTTEKQLAFHAVNCLGDPRHVARTQWAAFRITGRGGHMGVGLRWWFVQCSNRYDVARLVPREGGAA